jgi:hypothetical protein
MTSDSNHSSTEPNAESKTGPNLYDRVAEETARCRHPPVLHLLRAGVTPARAAGAPSRREHLALVRVADEVVDGEPRMPASIRSPPLRVLNDSSVTPRLRWTRATAPIS